MKITVDPFLPLNHQKRRRIVEQLNILYKTKWNKLHKVLIERVNTMVNQNSPQIFQFLPASFGYYIICLRLNIHESLLRTYFCCISAS